MLRYVLKRILWMIPVLLGVLVIVFTISYITPGDPAISILGTQYTEEAYIALREKLGLDKSFIAQLIDYIKNLFKGDMGISYMQGTPVSEEIAYRFPTTFKIGILSVVITVLLGVPLGILSATKQYSVADYSVTTIALILAAIPNYVLALFALILFSVKLEWLPVTGIDTWKGWILPLMSNSLGGVAVVARMTRTSMLEVIRQEYVSTAKAKGLKSRLVIWKHAFPNALIPVVTVVGMQLSFIMAGSIIVETIYAIPGMGMYILKGIQSRDYPIINGTVLVLSMCISVMNLLVDLAYAFIDPRIKAQYKSAKRVKISKAEKEAA